MAALPPRNSYCVRIFAICGAALVATFFFAFGDLLAQSGGASITSTATADRLKAPGWWPTKRDTSRDEYVGAAVCAECHDSEVSSASKSAMAHAATRAPQAESLQQVPLAFQLGAYRYQISDSGAHKILKISKGGMSRSAPLLWAFGMGRIAQTYVYEQGGNFYESHVSFTPLYRRSISLRDIRARSRRAWQKAWAAAFRSRRNCAASAAIQQHRRPTIDWIRRSWFRE